MVQYIDSLRRSEFFCPTLGTMKRLKGLKPYQDKSSFSGHSVPPTTRNNPPNCPKHHRWASVAFK